MRLANNYQSLEYTNSVLNRYKYHCNNFVPDFKLLNWNNIQNWQSKIGNFLETGKNRLKLSKYQPKLLENVRKWSKISQKLVLESQKIDEISKKTCQKIVKK